MALPDMPVLALAVPLLLILAVPVTAAEQLYVSCSTPDNQWVSDWPPVDSPATVPAMFEWLHDTWGVSRMYWRGGQARMWLENAHFRPENPRYFEWWTSWLRHLSGQVKTDELALKAARRLGVEMYMVAPLFDYGTPGDTGGGHFPYGVQDKLLLEHPEWRPVDRWGERLAPGPPEFCYPELRRILVDRLVKHVVKPGYDGLFLYTYVENMGQRYMDEFGYNQPIVAEFKRRHGVDIRREPFDKEAWNKLRGEYVTQFLAELHEDLKAKGKQLSMVLRPDQPNLPQRWLCIQSEVLPTGAIHMDWEGWVKQGVVDELFVWCGDSPDALIPKLLAACRGTPVKIVVFSSSPFSEKWQALRQQGLVPCSEAAPGYGIDPWAREETTPADLKSRVWRLRAQTLVDIGDAKVTVAPEAVAAMLADPHVLVRREALRALAKLKATDQVAAVEGALADRETSVRTAAATALGAINGPKSAELILTAMEQDEGFQYRNAGISSLTAMKDAAMPALQAHAKSRRWWVREAVVRAMADSQHGDARGTLLQGLTDPDYRVRYHAVWNVKRFADGEVQVALVKALDDPTPTVQLRAATALGEIVAALPAATAAAAQGRLRRLFAEYGDDCTRSDGAWGWRVVGMALERFGPEAREALAQWRDQREDKWLAWNAYLVLHVRQNQYIPITCTEEEAVAAHEQFAPPFPGRRR